MVADGGGWRRWWLWQWRWRLPTMVPMAAMIEGHHPADGASSSAAVCGGGEGEIAGESLVEPFGRLTTATPFGVVPLLGGVVLAYPFVSLPYSPGENLASVPNERWWRSTSHPPWGHRFGKTSSCKDIVIGLCIGFEL
uniref:Uncharacterized protein n=1 Tax=Oryza barthii TaxID=65489 RepID=A0A0D3F2Z5_9ORYZ